MIRPITILSFLLLLFFSDCKNEPKDDATIRTGMFLISEKPVNVTFKKSEEIIFSETLPYGSLNDYIKIKPGKYSILVTSEGKEILSAEMGIAANGKYTLAIYGILQKEQTVNQTTIYTKLKNIVEGEDAITANGALPQMRILNDHFSSARDKAQLRWVHLVPQRKALEAMVILNRKEKSVGRLAYPKASAVFPFDPKTKNFKVSSEEKTIDLGGASFDINAEELVTFFVIPKVNGGIDDLQVVTGITKKSKK